MPNLLTIPQVAERFKRQGLPDADRITVELRGVARQFEEIGASEMLIRDFRTTAD